MATYAHCQLAILDDEGNLMVGASVEVRDEATGNLPTLYSIRDGTATKTNPHVSADGYADFYVAGGAYKITATLGADSVTLRYRGIGTASEYDINEVSRWVFPFASTGLLGDGEALPAIMAPVAVTIPEDCDGSKATPSEGAGTGAVVIQYEYSTDNGASWSNAFTATFTAGSRTPTFALAADLVLPEGALLRPKGPATHDATFAGFTSTIVSIIN